MLDKASFENQIRGMSDRELSEFNTRQIYDILANLTSYKITTNENFIRHESRLRTLERGNNSNAKLSVVVSAGVAGAVMGIGWLWNWLKN